MRRKTREVMIGCVGVGGRNPVRIQSMTTSPTDSVRETVEQIKLLADVGCEIARVTVQGVKEANACEEIKNSLIQQGYSIPLVADIHFFPKAPMIVADFVDKIRINPGNYVDPRARFVQKEYDDASYAAELARIEDNFSPLVLKLKEQGKPMRIGTNHGSLSDRIMNRYGDSPAGMVESALEYTRICRKLDYHNIIYSMKASNTVVMIEAYRLLVRELDALGWNYPLHLGVTEAGEGEDGRVKSAIGIGSLLLDGIGDTIRVSLTEDPWKEVAPCRQLVNLADDYRKDLLGYQLHSRVEPRSTPELLDPNLPSIHIEEALLAQTVSKFSLLPQADTPILVVSNSHWDSITQFNPKQIIYQGDYGSARKFALYIRQEGVDARLFLGFAYSGPQELITIHASAECGSLLVDGLFEGLAIDVSENLALSILQGTRRKTVKTEFISCPGCGRTLFDLQEVSKRIRKKTHHLPGVRIAIMGCIVNGPGEMADAHFGYVGSKPGKIDLYIGKKCVERDVDFDQADEKLIELIKKEGMWQNPPFKKISLSL